MPNPTIEERLSALEIEVTRLKQGASVDGATSNPIPLWWEEIRGRFKDDSAYEEAMRYGREYRESLKPDDNPDNLA